MPRPKKRVSVVTPLQRMHVSHGEGVPFRTSANLVDWLNSTLSSSPVDREAAERVGSMIRRLNRNAARLRMPKDIDHRSLDMRRWFWAVGISEKRCVPLLQTCAPFYNFNFDLYPPWGGRDNWRLIIKISFSRPEDSNRPRDDMDKGQRMELEAVDTVVDLALSGLLGRLKDCKVRDCGKWFVTKNDPRVQHCKAHTYDDLRQGTPKRKKQLNEAAKNARKHAKTVDVAYWENARKGQLKKPSSRRAQR